MMTADFNLIVFFESTYNALDVNSNYFFLFIIRRIYSKLRYAFAELRGTIIVIAVVVIFCFMTIEGVLKCRILFDIVEKLTQGKKY